VSANGVEAASPTAIRDAAGAAPLSAAADSSRSLAGKSTAPGRLLVTDDNPLNLDVAARILRGLGYEVLTAQSAAAALEHLAQGSFDLVLMDCEMPDMDGIEATRLARRAEEARSPQGQKPQRVPIIALTAHSADEIQDECTEAGMNDFITKPLTKKKLQDALGRWLDEPATQSSVPGSEASERISTAAPCGQTSSVDTSVLASVMAARPGDAREFITRLIFRFDELATRQIAQLWQAYREGRSDEVSSLAHGLKSSAGAIGACQVASRAGEIERHVRHHGLTGLEPILAPLDGDLAGALSGLSEFSEAAG